MYIRVIYLLRREFIYLSKLHNLSVYEKMAGGVALLQNQRKITFDTTYGKIHTVGIMVNYNEKALTFEIVCQTSERKITSTIFER